MLHENGLSLTFTQYLQSGHFLQATFENSESEFLQMFVYVWLTVYLRQAGSSESKSLDKKEDVDRTPQYHKNATWPVKKGGWVLQIYKHSLGLISFCFLLQCMPMEAIKLIVLNSF